MTRDAATAERDRAETRRRGPADEAASATRSPGGRQARSPEWDLGDRTLNLSRPRIMGILNLTPDSFSDGGELATLEAALRRAEAFVSAGADLLDVGGESTRPGAPDVGPSEEMDRILPFIREASSRLPVPISVDTRKAEVARAAVEAGATVVNDVSGLTHDPEMAPFVGECGVGVVIMHMRGSPATMGSLTDYGDVVAEVAGELEDRLRLARNAGIGGSRVVLDPGIGFAKDASQSLVLLRDLHRIVDLGFPVLVGPSRKSFLGAVLGTPPADRLEGTLAACAAAHAGGARIFRVHDVEPVSRLLRVLEAVRRGSPERNPEGGSDGEGGAPGPAGATAEAPPSPGGGKRR